MIIWQVLVQFIFRLSFGVALCMGITPPRLVPSGFFRIHLWVLMGLYTFAALALYSQPDTIQAALGSSGWLLGLAVAGAVASYVGSVVWLYEWRSGGVVVLFLVALLALAGAALSSPWPAANVPAAVLTGLDLLNGGLLLGSTLTAMLLGHWYLNAPMMDLLPLKRLVVVMGVSVLIRVLLAGCGLAWHLGEAASPESGFWIFITFRWLTGLAGTFTMAVMAWYSLQVPNTQSATGILYAGVILAFLGELTSRLLSAATLYPV